MVNICNHLVVHFASVKSACDRASNFLRRINIGNRRKRSLESSIVYKIEEFSIVYKIEEFEFVSVFCHLIYCIHIRRLYNKKSQD